MQKNERSGERRMVDWAILIEVGHCPWVEPCQRCHDLLVTSPPIQSEISQVNLLVGTSSGLSRVIPPLEGRRFRTRLMRQVELKTQLPSDSAHEFRPIIFRVEDADEVPAGQRATGPGLPAARRRVPGSPQWFPGEWW